MALGPWAIDPNFGIKEYEKQIDRNLQKEIMVKDSYQYNVFNHILNWDQEQELKRRYLDSGWKRVDIKNINCKNGGYVITLYANEV